MPIPRSSDVVGIRGRNHECYTRGGRSDLLLAGAVAGAAAFPRFLAGPGTSPTPTFAALPADGGPSLVRAAALPTPAVLRPHPTAPAAALQLRVARHVVAPPAPAKSQAPVVRAGRPRRHPAAPAPAPAPVTAPAPPAATTPTAPSRWSYIRAGPGPGARDGRSPQPRRRRPTPSPAPEPSPQPAPSPSHDHGNGDHGEGTTAPSSSASRRRRRRPAPPAPPAGGRLPARRSTRIGCMPRLSRKLRPAPIAIAVAM